MNKERAVLGVLIVVGLAALAATAATEPVIKSGADLKWVTVPLVRGAQSAVLWGDPKTTAYGAFKKIPGGGNLAMHTHSNDQKTILITGTIVLEIQGQPAKELTAPSYAFIPAGMPHKANCKAGADCLYFEEQPGPSDMKPVK